MHHDPLAEPDSERLYEQPEDGTDIDPTTMHLPLESNAIDAANDSVVDDDPSAEPDTTYFAPTDPVIGTRADGNIEVLNGFAPTSESATEPDVSSDYTYGDEALSDAISRELRADAATTDLQIAVYVENGVAYLHGLVASYADAGNAEDVASRVPGILEVVEELDIAGM